MFKKQEEGGSFKEVETIIGPSVKVKGNFNGQGNIIVEGIIEGGLKTDGNVLIGDSAKITANVEAQEMRIGGEVNGNVKAKGYLEITSTAQILGDIECSALSVEKGAIINGKCTMGGIANGKSKETEE
ncbi:MAG: polymer-forming cytoskeletal protein [Patescibacteria group bacterium]|nr:polymer-forming cytoskeletal protein [Patescibacteria group bacterium]MDD4610700.1 polymer-forming cytoskeletal protein [Patescibacteria group bacterium]